jgi:hypothetical protein
MPYLNGKKVSNEAWVEAKSGAAVGWKDAFGYQDGPAAEPEPEPEAEPKKRVRGAGKKQEAKAALAAVTGLDIDPR